jgi:uncharacterized membrane protein
MPVWSTALAATSSAFLASMVEAVEAFTIILAVATIQGWRPAVAGALAGLIGLAVLVAALGPALGYVPVVWLELAIGALLLLFGLRWLRKAILRSAGAIPLHDETATFAAETAQLRDQARRRQRAAWIAGLIAFKAVLLEGLEVVFIVIAVGAGGGLLRPAALGAVAAGVLVLATGCVARRPLARVPENALKFGVGVLLSAVGVFWSGEGLGVPWPDGDWTLLGLIFAFLLPCLAAIAIVRRRLAEDIV